MAYQVDCSVPQGSGLGPLGFVAYTDDITDAIEQHDVSPHLYADDTQLLAKPEDGPAMRQQIGSCVTDALVRGTTATATAQLRQN